MNARLITVFTALAAAIAASGCFEPPSFNQRDFVLAPDENGSLVLYPAEAYNSDSKTAKKIKTNKQNNKKKFHKN